MKLKTVIYSGSYRIVSYGREEWVYDENDKPSCTSWKKWDWGNQEAIAR